MASTTDTAYADAVAAATNPDSWDVNQSQEITEDGLPATVVEGRCHSRRGGRADRYLPLRVFRRRRVSAGTVSLFTTGSADDETYQSLTGVVTLMAGASTFVSGN